MDLRHALTFSHNTVQQDIVCDVDVPEEGLERIAAATLHDRGLATNPKPISAAAPILSVLHTAW